MKIGALIVTTGLSRISGVAALLSEVGSISAGQRMISAFQCADVAMTALVTGREDKKQERLFSQPGVIFLRCGQNATFMDGVREGLRYFADKYDRVFLVPGDMPLFLPGTLRALLSARGSVIVPTRNRVHGYPLLLDRAAMEALSGDAVSVTLEEALARCLPETTYLPVPDPGVLLCGEALSAKKDLIQQQDQQLIRPMLDVTLRNGSALYDSKLSMLLHLVEDTGSVRDACSFMQISYSTAWNMLNHIEDELGYPLVVRIRGGSIGSGSILTEKGRALMNAYDRFTEDLRRRAATLYRDFFGDLT